MLASKLGSNEADCYNGLGNLYQDHLGRHEEAERAYLRAIELDPKYRLPALQPGQSVPGPPGSVRGVGAGLPPRHRARPEASPPRTTAWATCTRTTWAGPRSRSGPTSAPSSSTRSSPPRTTAWATCTRTTWAARGGGAGLPPRHRARPEGSPPRTTAWATCTRTTWVGPRSRSGPTSAPSSSTRSYASPHNGLGILYQDHLGGPRRRSGPTSAPSSSTRSSPSPMLTWANSMGSTWVGTRMRSGPTVRPSRSTRSPVVATLASPGCGSFMKATYRGRANPLSKRSLPIRTTRGAGWRSSR